MPLSMPTTAIVLAAGEGTRMKSKHPKVVHTILGRPLISWSIHAAFDAGANRVLAVVHPDATEVHEVLARDFAEQISCQKLALVYQKNRKGTGHAVMTALDAIKEKSKESVLVLYGDTPLISAESLRRLLELQQTQSLSAALLTTTPPDPSGYGRIIQDVEGDLLGIIEDKDCTPEQRQTLTLCNPGMYAFAMADLKTYITQLSTNNAQGEYYLTDMIAILLANNKQVTPLHLENWQEVIGVNDRVQLANATKLMQRRINHAHLSAGVTMIDPEQIWIGPDVSLASDVTLLPQTVLLGRCSVGSDTVLGPNTRLTNCLIGERACIEETVAFDAQLDDEVSVGPRAYLRPGTHLCKGAHVGTHVEIKNSTIGEGSKVPHLSYIGDTTMGSGVNIGAGSITCNYDGVNKHKTQIGDKVFVGSDTMMVAPVSIGDGALVGASSCITSDIPADALALERSELRVVEHYAAKRLERLQAQKAQRADHTSN